MAERKQHHFFDSQREEEKPAEEAMVYSETSYGSGGYGNDYSQTTEAFGVAHDTGRAEYDGYKEEEEDHKRKEHRGEMGALAAGAFALYEKHEAKKDPEHAHRHKLEEEIAGVVAVGSGGYAFHEKHEKKESRKEAEDAERSSTPFQQHEGAFQHHEGQGMRTSIPLQQEEGVFRHHEGQRMGSSAPRFQHDLYSE